MGDGLAWKSEGWTKNNKLNIFFIKGWQEIFQNLLENGERNGLRNIFIKIFKNKSEDIILGKFLILFSID